MRFIDNIVVASAFASVVSASPLAKRGNAFTVTQSVAKTQKAAGPVALAKIYGKYAKIGAQVPEVVKAAAINATQYDNGAVATTPTANDEEYLTPVSIGGQTLNLDFDTGSSDLWVYSTELPANEQTGHSVYDPSVSGSVKSGYTWSITYGDGSSASGNVFADTVNVGGTTVTSQAVEAAETLSAQFLQDVNNDGLLGLAFPSINTVQPQAQNTFFGNAEAGLQQRLFTANLKKGQPGSYDFGFIDSSQYTGSITYTPVDNSQGFWGFTSNGYAIGTGSFTTSADKTIADTGTTLMLIPAATVKAYYAKVSGSTNSRTYGGYVFPCSANLPSFTVGIGSYRAVIPGSYINYAPVTTGSSTCYGGIQSNAGIGFSIYGDIFLKSQFVVFSDAAGGPQLGFAAKPL